MDKTSIDFLDANRHHYDLWQRAKIMKDLDGATRRRLLEVIRKEFNPGYLADLWCGPCVAETIRYAYVQYDQWKSINKQG